MHSLGRPLPYPVIRFKLEHIVQLSILKKHLLQMQLLHLHAGHMATAICRSLFRPATHSSVSFCLSCKLCTLSSVLAERPSRKWQSLSDRSAVAVAASAFLPTHRTSAAIFLSLASSVEGEYGRPFFTAFFARARTLVDCLAFC